MGHNGSYFGSSRMLLKFLSRKKPTKDPISCAMAIVKAALVAVVIFTLQGCEEIKCERDGIGACYEQGTINAAEVCGENGFTKVLSGDTSVLSCCEAMKRVQDCYTVCSCSTPCDPSDIASTCPTTKSMKDPIDFWTVMAETLDYKNWTCSSVGVQFTVCAD